MSSVSKTDPGFVRAHPSLEGGYWEAAIQHYLNDRLEPAYDLVSRHGAGDMAGYLTWFRFIEAEWLTRQISQIEPINDWLTLEYVPDPDMPPLETLKAWTLEACDDAANRLGWKHGPKTWVTIMARQANAPWAVCPYGYCQDKYPFEKIGVPAYAVQSERYYKQVVAHEYAHVITLNLSQGRAPHWLHEALSVLVERDPEWSIVEGFAGGYRKWMTPGELEAVLELHTEDSYVQDLRIQAYEQAGWIGRYLAELQGEHRLGKLLREHAEAPWWQVLLWRFLDRTSTDVALWRCYRRMSRATFDEAFEFMKSALRRRGSS